MAGYVLIKKTLFQDLEKKQGSSPELADARRPYMGIQAREDIPSTISVLRKDGSSVDLLDYAARTGNAKTSVYTNFICQKITRVENEKIQIQETWGEDYLIVFGKRPLVLQVQGILVTAPNFPWEAEFWYNYENTLRATRLAELGARIFLQVDNAYYTGYMNNAQGQRDEQVQNQVPFAFTLFCTNTGYIETQKLTGGTYNLGAQDTSTVALSYPSQVDDGEYLTRSISTPEQYAFLTRRPTEKQWRNKRKQLLEGEAGERTEQLAQDPQKYAKIVGALSKDTPKTYTKPLGKGWTNTGTGKSNNKVWELPPDDAFNSLVDSAKVFSDTLTSTFTEQSVRNLAGEAERISRTAMGIGSELAGIIERPITATQELWEDLQEVGNGFVESAQSILEDTSHLVDGMIGLGAGEVASLEHARRVMTKAGNAGKSGFRLPRTGAFLIGGV